MSHAVYNSGIPESNPIPADRGAACFVRRLRFVIFLVTLLNSLPAHATDWSGAE